MTAREMFKELDFNVVGENDNYIIYENEFCPSETVFFDKEERDYSLEDMPYISLELHQAIHQQVNELGW